MLFLFISMMFFSACTDSNKGYQKISQSEAYEMMKNENVVILDVRTQSEYESGHIKNAILIPDYEIKNRAEEILLNKEDKILVYCRSGNRSKTASKNLLELGYKYVYDFGGINTWEYEIA